MRRRNKTGDKVAKTQRFKTLKQRNASKAVRRRSSSAVGQETKVARLTRELKESREQQTATSEILKVISSSPGELEPVFNAMLANATHICEAKFGTIFQFDGERFRCMAEVGSPPVLPSSLNSRGHFNR